jgi:paraquat-inducible protein B
MSRQANPTLIGAFVLGALTLGSIAVLLLAGGHWFQERRQYVMFFEGAAQGLQIGSPVVFLGVKVGTVKRIQLGMDEKTKRFLVPVTVEIEPQRVQPPSGEKVNLQDPKTIQRLVKQGLRARLKIQSLLTGQLYIDLDFYPDKPAHFFARDSSIPEIPTIPTTVEELTGKLERFPMEKFLNDLAEIGESIKTILSSEPVKNIPLQLEATLAHLESLSAKVDRSGNELLIDLQAGLTEMRKALEAVQTTMLKVDKATGRIGEAADRVGIAAGQIGSMAEAGSPMFTSITDTSNELSKTASVLQNLAVENSPTVVRLNTALQEISRAARALRLLAETLEQQPEAILRGKQNSE